jgi:hypothetical protein
MSSKDFNRRLNSLNHNLDIGIDVTSMPSITNMRGQLYHPVVSQTDESSCGAIALHVLLKILRSRPIRGNEQVRIGNSPGDMGRIRTYVIDEYLRLFKMASEQGHLTKMYALYPESRTLMDGATIDG